MKESLRIAVGVPVLNNFNGFAELINCFQGEDVRFIVEPNWKNNIGVSKSWNKFIDKALDYNYNMLIVANDDVTFTLDSFYALVRAWLDRPDDVMLVSGVGHDISEGYHDSPNYSFFAIDPRQNITDVGYFDENFTPAYFEDNDHHYRVRLAEKRAVCYSGARIEHKGSQTQNHDPKKPVVTSEMFEKNRAYYIDKWGGPPGEEKFTTPFNKSDNDYREWRL